MRVMPSGSGRDCLEAIPSRATAGHSCNVTAYPYDASIARVGGHPCVRQRECGRIDSTAVDYVVKIAAK
jgi:hypothetical protein